MKALHQEDRAPIDLHDLPQRKPRARATKRKKAAATTWLSTWAERSMLLKLLAAHDLANLPRSCLVELIRKSGVFHPRRVAKLDLWVVAEEVIFESLQGSLFGGDDAA